MVGAVVRSHHIRVLVLGQVVVDAVIHFFIAHNVEIDIVLALDAAIDIVFPVDAAIDLVFALDAAIDLVFALDAAIDHVFALNAAIDLVFALDAAIDLVFALDATINVASAHDDVGFGITWNNAVIVGDYRATVTLIIIAIEYLMRLIFNIFVMNCC